MIMTTAHANCTHPSTKAARAKCRRDAAKAPQVASEPLPRPTLADAVNGYYDDSLEAEEFAATLLRLQGQHPDLKPLVDGYYDNSLDLEEIAAGALRLVPYQAEPEAPTHTDRPVPPMPKISPRLRGEKIRMRGTADRKSDTGFSFMRRIAGKEFDFSIIRWAGGDEGSTITVREGGTTNVLKEFNRTKAETFAHHNRRR